MKKTLIILTLLFNCIPLFSQNENKLNLGDIIGIWYVINFDDSVNYIYLDSSAQNIWQMDHPQKTFFNAAYSAENAMVTDTLNPYPTNTYSYFDLYIGQFNFPMYSYDICIDFWHKFDTDTLKDGGYMTVSYDKGITWMNVINDSLYLGDGTPDQPMPGPWGNLNLYTTENTLFNGESGFSGHSNGWVNTVLHWYVTPMKKDAPSDTMIIRFNFISDSINNAHEGWLIDDIRLFSIDNGGGIQDFNKTNFVNVSPNPFNTSTELLFDKTYTNIELTLSDLQGKSILKKTVQNHNKITLDRTGIENGLYLLKITLDNKITETKKILITD